MQVPCSVRTIAGVPGPDGQLPIISGEDSVVSPKYDFCSANRSVIRIGSGRFEGSMNDPLNGETPKYIIIENLDIRSARRTSGSDKGYTYKTYNNTTG